MTLHEFRIWLEGIVVGCGCEVVGDLLEAILERANGLDEVGTGALATDLWDSGLGMPSESTATPVYMVAPEGCVMVPRVLTEAQIEAGQLAMGYAVGRVALAKGYKAMIEAGEA